MPSQDIKTAVAERIKDQAAECSRATAGRRSSETRTGPRQKEELANSARPVSDGSTFSCLRHTPSKYLQHLSASVVPFAGEHLNRCGKLCLGERGHFFGDHQVGFRDARRPATSQSRQSETKQPGLIEQCSASSSEPALTNTKQYQVPAPTGFRCPSAPRCFPIAQNASDPAGPATREARYELCKTPQPTYGQAPLSRLQTLSKPTQTRYDQLPPINGLPNEPVGLLLVRQAGAWCLRSYQFLGIVGSTTRRPTFG